MCGTYWYRFVTGGWMTTCPDCGYDKPLLMQLLLTNNQSQRPASTRCWALSPTSTASNKPRCRLHLSQIPSSCLSWKVSPAPTVLDKNKCRHFYLPVQRLRNFALISVRDRDFMRVTRGDQQWFGEQSPSPILHKEPNMVCLGSGPSLDRGSVMSIV